MLSTPDLPVGITEASVHGTPHGDRARAVLDQMWTEVHAPVGVPSPAPCPVTRSPEACSVPPDLDLHVNRSGIGGGAGGGRSLRRQQACGWRPGGKRVGRHSFGVGHRPGRTPGRRRGPRRRLLTTCTANRQDEAEQHEVPYSRANDAHQGVHVLGAFRATFSRLKATPVRELTNPCRRKAFANAPSCATASLSR